jgi:hypothetical protein
MTSSTETITWHLASVDLPDAGLSVLMYLPAASDPIYMGYWDDDDQAWVHDCGMRVKQEVTHWAEMPKGPTDE